MMHCLLPCTNTVNVCTFIVFIEQKQKTKKNWYHNFFYVFLLGDLVANDATIFTISLNSHRSDSLCRQHFSIKSLQWLLQDSLDTLGRFPLVISTSTSSIPSHGTCPRWNSSHTMIEKLQKVTCEKGRNRGGIPIHVYLSWVFHFFSFPDFWCPPQIRAKSPHTHKLSIVCLNWLR